MSGQDLDVVTDTRRWWVGIVREALCHSPKLASCAVLARLAWSARSLYRLPRSGHCLRTGVRPVVGCTQC